MSSNEGAGGETKKRRTDGGAPAALLLGGRELPTAVLIHALSYLSAWRLYALLGVNKEMQRVATITPRNAYTAWRVDTRIPSEDDLRWRLVGMQREGKTLDLRAIPGPYRRLEIRGAADAAPVDQMVNHVMYTSRNALRVLRTPELPYTKPGPGTSLLALDTRRGLLYEDSTSTFIEDIANAHPKLRELTLDVLPFAMPDLSRLSELPLRALNMNPVDYDDPTSDTVHVGDGIDLTAVEQRSADLPVLQILSLPLEWLALVYAPSVTHLKIPAYLYYEQDGEWDVPIATTNLAKQQIAKIHEKFPLLQVLAMYDPRPYLGDYPRELGGPDCLPEGKDVQMKHLRFIYMTCDTIPGFLATATFPALEYLEVDLLESGDYLAGARLFQMLRNMAHIKTIRLMLKPYDNKHIYKPEEDQKLLDRMMADDVAQFDRVDVAWQSVCLPGCAMMAAAILRRVRFTKKTPVITACSTTCCGDWYDKDNATLEERDKLITALVQREFRSVHADQKAPTGSLDDYSKYKTPDMWEFERVWRASQVEVNLAAQAM